jgi:hypothetical protein
VSGQTSTSETCPTCGTIKIRFDPPLIFEASEASEICGAAGAPQQLTVTNPTCERVGGHPEDEDHIYLVEGTVHWKGRQ